ncbi:MAG: hypothetical protein R2761_21730 [Acidimicrobiales bacterium]
MGMRRRAVAIVLNSAALLAACSSGSGDTATAGLDGPATSVDAAPGTAITVPAAPVTAVPPTVPAATGPNQPSPGGTGPPVPALGDPVPPSSAGGAPGSPSALPDSPVPPLPPGAGAAGLTGAPLEEYLARRYEAYWDAFDAARTHPTADPGADFPELAELAAGAQLDLSHQSIADLAAAGEATREPSEPAIGGTDAATEHRVRVDRVDGAAAELTACVVNDDVRYVVATNQVVDAGVRTVRSTATMALTGDGRWKLIRSQAVAIDDGVTGCWNGTDYPY